MQRGEDLPKKLKRDHEKSINDKNITKHIKKFIFVNLYKLIIKEKM
jgi:hypothetical protein